jgi:hypothetical protein
MRSVIPGAHTATFDRSTQWPRLMFEREEKTEATPSEDASRALGSLTGEGTQDQHCKADAAQHQTDDVRYSTFHDHSPRYRA